MSDLFWTPEIARDLASKRVWVLDVDKTLYPISCGFHEKIEGKITSALDMKYDPYEKIPADPILLEALKMARSKGIEIYIYTNATSASQEGKESHVQKVLHAIGCDTEMVEWLRSRTHDIINAAEYEPGKFLPKGTLKGMNAFLQRFGIDSEEAVMFDDDLEYLEPACQRGMAVVWAWTTSEEPDVEDRAFAQQNGIVRIQNVGESLLQIVENAPCYDVSQNHQAPSV